MTLTVHIITDFSESMKGYLDTSIMRIASEKHLFSPKFYRLGDFSTKPTKRVDDRPYGGGAGTLLQIEPLYGAISHIHEQINSDNVIHIFLGPRGETLKQSTFEKYIDIYKEMGDNMHIICVCGHYEGVDGRLFDIFDFSIYSLGDFVISSGELATTVFIDGLVRLLPGVVGNPESIEEESFSSLLNGKKEFLQYSRPSEFKGHKVPEELMSGDHKKIQTWKKSNLL